MDDIRLIPRFHSSYPSLLGQIHDPPGLLAVQGPLEIFSSCAYVVSGGSRASPESRAASRLLGYEAAEAGALLVTDGRTVQAREAAWGALDAGGPLLLVLPGDPGNCAVPPRIGRLWEVPPRGMMGCQRILAGLSYVICFIDAPWSPPVRMLAECALEEGRDVVVHRCGKDRRGSKRLAEAGAEVLSSSQRLLELLAAWKNPWS